MDPLAGMSAKKARELVGEAKLACEDIEGVDMLTSDFKKFYALAALGAECVGADGATLHGHHNTFAKMLGPVSLHGPTRLESMSGESVRRVLVLKEDK